MIIDFTRVREASYAHQVVGVRHITSKPAFLLADEMGAGKTKQAIDSAMVLFQNGAIDRVIVVAPAAVRDVWFDSELGELRKHLWNDVPCWVTRWHSVTAQWKWFCTDAPDEKPLRWIVTNYEYIRAGKMVKVGKQQIPEHLFTIMKLAGPRTLLILDESSAIKSYDAAQTKACLKLRKRCGRVLLLNGTPIADSPLDIYSQANVMSPSILGCTGITAFRSRYAIMGGFIAKTPWGDHPTQVLKWVNLEDLQQRMAPYVLRRLKADCLDLPAKLPPVALSVPLEDRTWQVYQQMKAEMVAWLGSSVSSASIAIVKIMRLAQITSGFVGGIESLEDLDGEPDDSPWTEGPRQALKQGDWKRISHEKQDAYLTWLNARLDEDPNAKILTWSRFRPEVATLLTALPSTVERGVIWGAHAGKRKAEERTHALRLLDPRTAPKGPVVVVGTPATGSMGLNLTAAAIVMYMSNDWSLKTRLQSEDRTHRPGQTRNVSYFDLVATGPKGQKTIDHRVIGALRTKQNLAEWTASAWIHALTQE